MKAMDELKLQMIANEKYRQDLLNEHVLNIGLVGTERHQTQQVLIKMQTQRDEALATIEKMQQDWSHVLRSKPIKYICIWLAKRWGPHPAVPGNMRSTIVIVRRVSFSIVLRLAVLT